MPRGCLQFMIVVFPDHTHLLFLKLYKQAISRSESDQESQPASLADNPLEVGSETVLTACAPANSPLEVRYHI